MKVVVCLFWGGRLCNFEVFSLILVIENKCNCSPLKSALSCFCCFFCALSWTFMSLPVSDKFVSYLFQLVSCCMLYVFLWLLAYCLL